MTFRISQTRYLFSCYISFLSKVMTAYKRRYNLSRSWKIPWNCGVLLLEISSRKLINLHPLNVIHCSCWLLMGKKKGRRRPLWEASSELEWSVEGKGAINVHFLSVKAKGNWKASRGDEQMAQVQFQTRVNKAERTSDPWACPHFLLASSLKCDLQSWLVSKLDYKFWFGPIPILNVVICVFLSPPPPQWNSLSM